MFVQQLSKIFSMQTTQKIWLRFGHNVSNNHYTPQGWFSFHIQSSLQVGSGLGFTDETKTRISDALCQDKWQPFFKQWNLKPSICLLTHIQNNTSIRCQRSEGLWGEKLMENQSISVDYFAWNPIWLKLHGYITYLYLEWAFILIN